MSLNPQRLKLIDPWLIFSVAALLITGLVILHSASGNPDAHIAELFQKQLIFALIGIGLMIGAAFMSPRAHFALAYLLYCLACLTLLGTLIWGSTTKGAESWLELGLFTYQPAEPAKIALVLALARMMSDKKFDATRPGHIFRAMLLTAVPLLLVLAQPDLGTAIVFPATFLFMIIAVGIPTNFLVFLLSPVLAAITSFNLTLLLIFVLVFALAAWLYKTPWMVIGLLVAFNLSISFATPQLWNHLKPYQRNRLVSFIHPEADPKGSGYQVIQSKVAIGSGGIKGKGLGKGSQTQLKFIPEQHTDFVYSVVGEELGLIGAGSVLILLFVVMLRGLRAAQRAKGRYSALLCTGLIAMISVHIFINIGMALGLMPVTGLPLPFLSYGGSFLWTVMIAMGLILGVQLRWKEYTP
ncbi:MAG: rod shape-determining protein RodA [bacterium]|nr:rod shape-determining protein RodA [bacterium]